MRYLLILSLFLISCVDGEEILCCAQPVYKLQVRNGGYSSIEFKQVALPNNLLIVSQDNETFEITNLEETGNLTATVVYSCEGGDNDSKDLTVNFYDDKKTVIEVDGVIRTQAGCTVGMNVYYEPY